MYMLVSHFNCFYIEKRTCVKHARYKWLRNVFCSGCRQKSSPSFLNRSDLPSLAYHKLKGKNPGVVFLPGLFSNMSGDKALALEEYCRSVGHAFVRYVLRERASA